MESARGAVRVRSADAYVVISVHARQFRLERFNYSLIYEIASHAAVHRHKCHVLAIILNHEGARPLPHVDTIPYLCRLGITHEDDLDCRTCHISDTNANIVSSCSNRKGKQRQQHALDHGFWKLKLL